MRQSKHWEFLKAATAGCFTLMTPVVGGIVIWGNMSYLAAWLAESKTIGAGVLVCLVAVACGVGVVPIFTLAILSGWALGFVIGGVSCSIGAMLAATLGFSLSKVLLRDSVCRMASKYQLFVSCGNKVAGMRPVMKVAVLAMMRFASMPPFEVANYLFASLKVPFGTYLIATAVGVIPRIAMLSHIGSNLDAVARNWRSPPWFAVVNIAASLLVMIFVTILINRTIRDRLVGLESTGEEKCGEHLGT